MLIFQSHFIALFAFKAAFSFRHIVIMDFAEHVQISANFFGAKLGNPVIHNAIILIQEVPDMETVDTIS